MQHTQLCLHNIYMYTSTHVVLTRGRPLKGFANFRHVHHDSLDTIALAFNFGNEGGHLVAVEGVTVLSVDVQQSHSVEKVG